MVLELIKGNQFSTSLLLRKLSVSLAAKLITGLFYLVKRMRKFITELEILFNLKSPRIGGLFFFNLVAPKDLNKSSRAEANIMINLFTPSFQKIKISWYNKMKISEMVKITSSKDMYSIFLQAWEEGFIDYKESFYIALLNRANRVLAIPKISEGGLSGTVADPKVIYQNALVANASSIILAHNHPSGNLIPSEADIRLTSKLRQAGEMLDLPVIDHLIISNETYYSFADEGSL